MLTSLMCLALQTVAAFADPTDQIPDPRFQGKWEVKHHYFRHLMEGSKDFENLGEETPKGKFPAQHEIRFRRHKSGAIQQIWTDSAGAVIESKGVTILKLSPHTVTYQAWSDHPTWKTTMTVKHDGSAVFQVRSLKHQETYILEKLKNSGPPSQPAAGEPGGDGKTSPSSRSKSPS
jgi:hypothetical protein